MPSTVITSSSSASVVFGCSAETGIIINSFTRTTSREKVEVTNEQGDVIALAYHKPMAAVTIEGVANGFASGIGLAAPGVALTINNTTSGSGITSGSILVNSTTRTQTSQDFASFSVDASQYPLIT
jgi:hypothetical protein